MAIKLSLALLIALLILLFIGKSILYYTLNVLQAVTYFL